MQTQPLDISLMFLILVGFLLVTLALGLKRSRRSLAPPFAVILAWLALTAFLSVQGVFADFSRIPPHFMLAALPSIATGFLLGCLPAVTRAARALSHRAIIALQSFRIYMEFILWLLVGRGILPEIMTFTGRNFDILVGLTAPLAAWWCFRGGKLKRKTLLAWNIAGIAILATVVFHGVLSAPTPWRVFHTEPSTQAFTVFPLIWLPCFVVPFAFFLHCLSISLLRRGR